VSVHFFHGDKGGVGKSFVDWLLTRNMTPLVVDSDMRNPDLARMFSGVAVTVDLRQHEGWLELLSQLHESEREQVVVSLPAGIGAEVTAELPAFFAGLRELRREATLLWILARTPDSINLLRPATAAFGGHARAMVALQNLAIRRVVKAADLDPVLLFFLADANAAAERDRIPETLKTAVDEGVGRLKAAIPSSGALAVAVAEAGSSIATFDRLATIMAAVKRWVILAAAVSAVVVIAFWIGGWRVGYGAGWDARRAAGYVPVAQQVCEALAHVRHNLQMHRAQVQALDRERVLRGC